MTKVRKFFADKQGNIAIVQAPNIPLIAWLVLLLLTKALPASSWRTWTSFLSSVSLLIWSILEIGWGASYFRRSLGVVVLGLLIMSRF